jgi:hypothetical protein
MDLNILDSPPFPTPGTHTGALNGERIEREGEISVSCPSRFDARALCVVTWKKDLPSLLELSGVTAPP